MDKLKIKISVDCGTIIVQDYSENGGIKLELLDSETSGDSFPSESSIETLPPTFEYKLVYDSKISR